MIKHLILNKTFKIHALVWIIYTFYYAFLVKLFYHIPVTEGFILRVLLYRFGEIALFYANVSHHPKIQVCHFRYREHRILMFDLLSTLSF